MTDTSTNPPTNPQGDNAPLTDDTPPPDAGQFANQDQDPDAPANNTQAMDLEPTPRPVAEPFNVAPEDLLTEQEKDAGNESMGVGPLARSESTSGPVETMEDLGIGPRTPYPTGDPPQPSESTTFGQGIKGVTDKASAKPGSSSGPAGEAPAVDDTEAAYDANQPVEDPTR